MKSVFILLAILFYCRGAHGRACEDRVSELDCREMIEANEHKTNYRMAAEVCGYSLGTCDTTGDCQAGWSSFNLGCYYISKKPMKYTDAKAYCQNHDGTLASISDESEKNFVAALARKQRISKLWIGVLVAPKRKSIFLTENSLVLKEDWITTLKNAIKVQNYITTMTLSRTGAFGNENSDNRLPFVCARLAKDFCSDKPCGKHAFCTYAEKGHKCQCATGYRGDPYSRCEAPCVCTGMGDPHYRTYDGEMIHFMGKCRYTLTESTDKIENKNCAFKIETQNEDRRTHISHKTFNVSWTKSVIFKFRGNVYQLRKKGQIVENNVKVSEVHNKDVTIAHSDPHETVIRPDPVCGILKITFDNINVEVRLDKITWNGKIRGICGNCNDDPSDEFYTKDNVDVSAKDNRHALLGNSWKVARKDKTKDKDCDDRNPFWPECSPEVIMNLRGGAKCGKIQSGDFADCYKAIKKTGLDVKSSCVMDNCVFKISELDEDMCSYYEMFAKFCRTNNFRVQSWRQNYGCVKTCPANSEYTYDLPKNEKTCANIKGKVADDLTNTDDDETDSEGCLCKKGFVKSGGQCVQHCGCNQDNKYHNKGDKWLSNNCKIEYTCADTGKITNRPLTCGENAACAIEEGVPTCVCNSGYKGDPFKKCVDINECEVIEKPCHELADCKNTPGDYECKCRDGFEGPGKTSCKNKNECELNTHDCGTNAICQDTFGSFHCTCEPGYELLADKKNCKDINECKTGNRCDKTTQKCKDTEGSYECLCLPGYRDVILGRFPRSPQCTDINECKEKKAECHELADCKNTIGSYTCHCKTGYIGDGCKNCTDENECIQDGKPSGICEQNCTNTIGSFDCSCDKGYSVDPGNKRKCKNINECDNKPCHVNADCKDTIGCYKCECKKGYRGDGIAVCEAINVCEDENPCDENAICEYTGPGEHNCKCKDGYTKIENICNDVNECSKKDACHPDASCTNTEGSYMCKCKQGLIGDGMKSCLDVNECLQGEHKCDEKTSKCKNIRMSYDCECLKGYEKVPNKERVCRDINECDREEDDCGPLKDCTNTIGSFNCTCKEGYETDGDSCKDKDECLKKSLNNCAGRSAKCINEVGGYKCECVGNYTGNGKVCSHKAKVCDRDPKTNKPTCTCTRGYVMTLDKSDCVDVNECSLDNDLCDENAECYNLEGSYMCKCKDGFCGSGLKGECKDFNECTSSENRCDKNAECINEVGSFKCKCKPGYEGDGFQCRDKNECLKDEDNDCNNADCENTDGDYKCNCQTGFKRDAEDQTGRKCVDVNECEGGHQCDLKVSDCVNDVGSYKCKCKTGYEKRNKICIDINECDRNLDDCATEAECSNTEGSFRCRCKTGYSGNGKKCENKNECSLGEYVCHDDGYCLDSVGSYDCKCKEGYEGDGKKECKNINECTKGTAQCDEHSVCHDTIGSYNCTCKQYYTGNGKAPDHCRIELVNECKLGTSTCDLDLEICKDLREGFDCECKPGYERKMDTCKDINECDKTPCSPNADCTNKPGSFKCKCKKGYSGNGFTCNDINECDPKSPEKHRCDLKTSKCKNTPPGSYSCECLAGYEAVNSKECKDINECDKKPPICGDEKTTKCRNKNGGHFCLCRNGYTQDQSKPGFKCKRTIKVPTPDEDPTSFFDYM